MKYETLEYCEGDKNKNTEISNNFKEKKGIVERKRRLCNDWIHFEKSTYLGNQCNLHNSSHVLPLINDEYWNGLILYMATETHWCTNGILKRSWIIFHSPHPRNFPFGFLKPTVTERESTLSLSPGLLRTLETRLVEASLYEQNVINEEFG